MGPEGKNGSISKEFVVFCDQRFSLPYMESKEWNVMGQENRTTLAHCTTSKTGSEAEIKFSKAKKSLCTGTGMDGINLYKIEI